MKTILTILLAAICLSATAQTNNDVEKFKQQLETITEAAFKAGAISGHTYTVLGIATNINGVNSVEAGHRIAEQAWGDFQEFQKGRRIESPVLITNAPPLLTNGFLRGIAISRFTNAYYAASNSPSTVRLELSGELKTNWVTTSIESPVVAKGHEFDAVMRYGTLHQTGTVISNTVANFQWNGKSITAIVNSEELFKTNRTISSMSSTINIQ